MATDIKQTGYQSYRELQAQNAEPFNPQTASAQDWYKQLKKRDYNSYSNQPTEYVGIEASQAGFGTSKYDEGLSSATQLNDLEDIRYENQPWYDILANGVGKMLGTAGTTFVSSLVGLPVGLITAATEGRWSGLWDNDVTQGLADVDKWLEENMTNYKSQKQQNSPWYDPSNLFSMNFIADDIIKNVGFTLGAAASMAVGAGSLGLMSKSLGFVNDVSKAGKTANKVLSSLFSATGEGMIEAKKGVDARNELELQRLEDALAPEKQALEEEFNAINAEYQVSKGLNMTRGADGQYYDPAYETFKQRMAVLQRRRDDLSNREESAKQQIEESGELMGNKILLGNQILLAAGNLIQFSKLMNKSFDNARHAAETSTKRVKPVLTTAERVSDNIKDGYKVTSKWPGRIVAGGKGLATEGSEEMNQQWIQSSSEAAYREEDVNDYWRAKLDPKAYRETTKGMYTLGNIINSGFQDSWGSPDQWEQFVIGGLTGMAGSYAPTKLFNQDKTKSRWDPRRYGSWEGGMYKEVSDFNKQYGQYEENVEDLNKILAQEDFGTRVQNLVAHTYLEGDKEYATQNNDRKMWQDADDKQTIHDIQAFLRAGKLDDLRAIYNSMSENLSNADIEDIIKRTTKYVSKEEDKRDYDTSVDMDIADSRRKIAMWNEQLQAINNELQEIESYEDGDVVVNNDSFKRISEEKQEKLLNKIARESREIERLNDEKARYQGREKYVSPFKDSRGNDIKTPDQIREEIANNTDEMQRKLDSYLESVAAVNEDTGGNLTKDQEDNLAYLHNLGKEKRNRADRIISGIRKEMPKEFLIKTDKTPEQLAKEYASSDRVFLKDDTTNEGYVKVDTSKMTDAGFRNFFIRDILWGGNINPEFAETEDEKAAREEEEKTLSKEEKRKRAKERASKKWTETVEKMQDEINEQRNANSNLIADFFTRNYRNGGGGSQTEETKALKNLFDNIIEASSLIEQAGEYDKVLRDYMRNPSLVDADKEKEEQKAQKEANENTIREKYSGKDSKQFSQDMADGNIDFDELSEFASMEDEGFDDVMKNAQEEAKKAVGKQERASSLKNHIRENLGDNPTAQELSEAEEAFRRIDATVLNSDNPEDISIDNAHIVTPSIDDTDNFNEADVDMERRDGNVMDMLAQAFTDMEEDLNAQDDIPDENPSVDDVDTPTTGHDATAKTDAATASPNVSSPSKATSRVIPKNPLKEEAIDLIMQKMRDLYSQTPTNGTWRSTTTRHPYNKSIGTYHEDIAKKQYGENSVEYKRSKAIWEYLNDEKAFDKQENASDYRIKVGDNIHFMVKYLPEVFDKKLGELSEEDKPYAMAIIMLNDNGEVLGDLPLAELEPSYKAGNPTPQVQQLEALQKKVFDAFYKNYEKTDSNEAIVDNFKKGNIDNLNLTFSNAKKTPLMSKVAQVMRGVVPFRKSEINTLNEVAADAKLELGVKVSNDKGGMIIATERKGKGVKNIKAPEIGSDGQPYMLLPTASGEKFAVPFYMTTFDAEKHQGTALYRVLSNAIYHLINSMDMNSNKKSSYFKQSIDVIEGLLQVKRAEGRVSEIKSDTVELHLQSLTDENQKINLSVPKVGTQAEIAKALARQLSGIPINVSLEYLNGNIVTGLKGDNNEYIVDYNQLIGEIATVNLPKVTQHTVNSWFTIELNPEGSNKKKVETKMMGTISASIGGRTVEINLDRGEAVDAKNPEVIVNDEEAALFVARAKAAKVNDANKKRLQISFNGDILIYDIEKDKFVNPPKQETEASTNTSNEAAQEESGEKKEGQSATQTEAQPKESSGKTLQEIEKELKDRQIIGRKTLDAWKAIPDNLKLKFYNDGVPLQLSYGGKTTTILLKNKPQMMTVLQEANIFAKNGNLEVTEAVKPMEKDMITINKEKERDARRWLTKNLPSLSSEERTQFVDKLSRGGKDAGKMWGSYKAGVIEIQRNAPMGTVYHEAFHYVMDMILSPEEKQSFIDTAKKEYGVDLTNWEAEERLANDFRRYAMDENATGIIGRIKVWFRKLLDKINRYNKISDIAVNNLFWKINNGEFVQRASDAENFDENQQIVLREIRNVQQEKYSWKNLDRNAKSTLKSLGVTEPIYQQMSLEEKEQYIKCVV